MISLKDFFLENFKYSILNYRFSGKKKYSSTITTLTSWNKCYNYVRDLSKYNISWLIHIDY
jgi:hypothetical protein